jgi:hypothetical protein
MVSKYNIVVKPSPAGSTPFSSVSSGSSYNSGGGGLPSGGMSTVLENEIAKAQNVFNQEKKKSSGGGGSSSSSSQTQSIISSGGGGGSGSSGGMSTVLENEIAKAQNFNRNIGISSISNQQQTLVPSLRENAPMSVATNSDLPFTKKSFFGAGGQIETAARGGFRASPPGIVLNVQERYFNSDFFREGLKIPKSNVERFLPSDFIETKAGQFAKGEKEIVENVFVGFVPKTPTEVGVTALSFGAGTIFGGAVRGGGAVVRMTSPKLVKPLSFATSLGGVGLAGFYGAAKTSEIIAAPDLKTKSQILGGTARELTAFGAGDILGSKIAGKSIGFFRTRGMSELSAENVVAPEFFKGQTFPGIKRGQTAGQLRKEFLGNILPSETTKEFRGFSARIQPFGKVTEGGTLRKVRSGYELEGPFFSPKISPQFLRASSERQRFFGFDEFGAIPTVERVKFKDITLAPGVSSTQRNLRTPFTLEESKFITARQRETGTAILPFIKSEKEVVGPIGTQTKITGKTFFFRDPISKERVPIIERELIPTKEFEGLGGKGKKGTKPLTELTSSFSKSRPSSTPSSFGAGLRTSSLLSSKDISSSFISSFGSSFKSPKSRPKVPYSDLGSGFSQPKDLFRTSSKPSDISQLSSLQPLSTSSFAGLSSQNSLLSGPKISKGAGLGGDFFEGRGRARGVKRKGRRTPSLVAIDLGLTSPSLAAGEESGLVARPLISGRSRRRKKK